MDHQKVIDKLLKKWISIKELAAKALSLRFDSKQQKVIKELMKKGILIREPSKVITKGGFEATVPERLEISPAAKERIFSATKSFIEKNAIITARTRLKSYLSRISQMPTDLRKAEIAKQIDMGITQQIETYGMEEAGIRAMLIDSFSLEDHLWFSEGKGVMHHNELVMEQLKLSTDIEFVKLLNVEYAATTRKQGQKYSYVWQGGKEELYELFALLRAANLIAQETTSDQFVSVFSNTPIENLTPIQWHDDTASEVLYFITRLEDLNNIEKSNRSDYEKLKACFVTNSGRSFEANFKNLKTNLTVQLAKEKQEVIDKIVSNF